MAHNKTIVTHEIYIEDFQKIRLIQGFDFNCYWKIQQDRHKYFKWRLFFKAVYEILMF